ncbi:Rieske 2Fe-2S domain-containing protein (plasmid) [Fibrella sp. ES10-3-2-2]
MSQVTKTDALSRHDFLRQLGFQGAALMAVYCAGQSLTSCSAGANVTPTPLNSPVTVDLTSAANAALKNVGGFVVTNNIVVANTTQGYVAATVVCSHEGQRQVQLRNNEFYCTAHGARFDLSGKGLNANGNRGLTVYKVAQSGNVLTIS